MSGRKVWRAEQLRQHPELRPAAEREQLARGELTLDVPDAISAAMATPALFGPMLQTYDAGDTITLEPGVTLTAGERLPAGAVCAVSHEDGRVYGWPRPARRLYLDQPVAEVERPAAPVCRSCGRPFSPTHDADAPGPTTRHLFRAVTDGAGVDD